jgi:hypothetical protein
MAKFPYGTPVTEIVNRLKNEIELRGSVAPK